MSRIILSFTLAISFLLLISTNAADSITKTPLQQSMDGNNLSNSPTPDDSIAFVHVFPFTDKRMKANQAKFENIINRIITDDLAVSTNVTEAAEKYPQDSPVKLTIEKKFAFHLFIEENLITLYTYSYDLSLDSCGANVQNLRVVHREPKKGNVFNLHSIPNKKYKILLESLITQSTKEIKSVEEQEIPLFITVDPELTFLPAATIEDALENLRLDFPKRNIKYCNTCPNILPYDEYAYLTWLTIFNYNKTSDNEFFVEKDQLVINLGLGSKAVFVAYPLEIAEVSTDDDKVVAHAYCLDGTTHVSPFVQNVYYERSLDKFTDDFLSSVTKEASSTKKSNEEKETVNFPCYPKYFEDKVNDVLVKGTGDYKSCKKDIEEFMNKPVQQASSEFNISPTEIIWPLDNPKNKGIFEEATIYIESEILESFMKVRLNDEKFKTFTIGKLSEDIQSHCSEFLSDVSGSLIASKNKIEYTNSCINLIYVESLLRKMGIKRDRELRLKIRIQGEAWINGITLRNIELFHSLEKEWFNAAQDRSLETYLLKVKDNQELDKQKAMNFTLILIVFLSLTFWVGFIIRFNKKEIPEAEDMKHK